MFEILDSANAAQSATLRNVDVLMARVEKLEAENARLRSRIAAGVEILTAGDEKPVTRP